MNKRIRDFLKKTHCFGYEIIAIIDKRDYDKCGQYGLMIDFANETILKKNEHIEAIALTNYNYVSKALLQRSMELKARLEEQELLMKGDEMLPDLKRYTKQRM